MILSKVLSGIPVIKLLIPFVAGILGGSGLQSSFSNFSLLFLFSFFSMILMLLNPFRSFSARSFSGFLLTLHFLNAGALSSCLQRENQYPAHFTRHLPADLMIALVDGMLTEKSNSYCLSLNIQAINNGRLWKKAFGKLLLYSRKKETLHTFLHGDRIVLRVRRLSMINRADGPWARLNHHRQQYARAVTSDIVLAGHDSGVSFKGLALSCRSLISSMVKMQFNGIGVTSLAIALLIGEEMRIPEEVMAAYSATGTLHVLSVSGMHVGLIFYLFSLLLKPLNLLKQTKGLYYIILIISLWFYAFIAGAVPSVVRASAMLTITLIAAWMKRETGGVSVLMSSVFILLMFDPCSLFEPGLQLSFLAVFGILWLQPGLSKILQPRTYVLKQGAALLTVSLAAQLMTFPVSLYYSGFFPNYFLPANLLVVPFTSLTIYSLLLQLALTPFCYLNEKLAMLNTLLLKGVNTIVTEMASWPYAMVAFRPDGLDVLLIFLALLLLIDWLFTRSFRRIIQLMVVGVLAKLLQITILLF